METQDSGAVKYIGIRVPPELHERFQLAARANHRPIEGELKYLMERRVEEFEAEIAAAA